MDLHASVVIDASPEDVWRELADIEHWPEWTASMTSVSYESGGPPLGVGTRARIKQPGMRAGTWAVRELDAPRQFTWASSQPGVTLVAGHRLAPVDGSPEKTLLTLDLELSGKVVSLAGRLLRSRAQRYLDMEANGLKARCEARSG